MEFGVSRTPVREALILLERQNLVVNEPNRGFFAASLSFEGLRSFFDMAAWLYPFLFQRAALRIAGRLPAAAMELRAYKCDSDPISLILLHFRFMSALASTSGNNYSSDVSIAGESYHCMMRASTMLSSTDASRLNANRRLFEDDCALLEAVLSGEGKGVEAAVSSYIASSREFLASSLI